MQASTHADEALRTDPAAELLGSAAEALRRAEWATSAAMRFELAYLCVLRSGAAVLARRARPGSLRTKPRGLWGLLAAAAPELTEWAEFFAVCGGHCTELIDGRRGVSARQADDLVRDADTFLRIARQCVDHGRGMPPGASSMAVQHRPLL